MSQPAFVLVRPQMGENVGAAARAMWNFGLDRLRVVAPRDDWPNPRAVAMASGAGRLLDDAGPYDDVAAAVAEATHVYATTARGRGLTKPVMEPQAAMADAARAIAAGGRVAVLFGPERAGLENTDIARAHALVTVPVNPAFPSLNLAQCVLLMAYEWRRTTVADPVAATPAAPPPGAASGGPAQSAGAAAGVRMEMARTEWATRAEIDALVRHYEDRLEAAGFFFPADKAPGMKLVLQNLWNRLELTRADVQLFHGILRAMVRWKERG